MSNQKCWMTVVRGLSTKVDDDDDDDDDSDDDDRSQKKNVIPL